MTTDGYGCCPACGRRLDVAFRISSTEYIPKILAEHQTDRLRRPAMPVRDGKPVEFCLVCYQEKT